MAVPAPAARGPTGLTLKTFVIGPQARGRGYRVLEPGGNLFGGSGDLAMILMEWSRTGEKSFAGCFPVSDPAPGAVVFRARNLGSATLGEIAFLHGVLMGASDLARIAHRSELLLSHIPDPDGTTSFAENLLAASIDSAAGQPPSDDLGLAWKDRLVLVEDGTDREAMLVQALASIDPPAQRPRISGWVTSGQLVSRGNLDLIGNSQIVVAGPSPGLDRGPESVIRVTSRGLSGERGTPPESWLAWSGLFERTAAESEFAPLAAALSWRPAYSGLKAAAAAEEALRIASGVLPRDAMVSLLKHMLSDDPPYAEAAGRIIPEYVDALELGGVGGEVRGELLESASLLPPKVAARLLGVAQPLLIAGMSKAQRRTILELAAGASSNELLSDPPARRALVTLMLKAIDVRDSEHSEIPLVQEIVEKWPSRASIELLELTAPAPFKTLIEVSGYFAASLARRLLSRNYYSVGVLGEEPLVLLHVFQAMRLLKT